MTKLLDLGLSKATSVVIDMAGLAQNVVALAIRSYKEDDHKSKDYIYERSAKLRFLQDEVSELTIELIARFQPVARDLRYIKSFLEISYGFSRFGRYAYDIITVVEILGPLKSCNKSSVLEMSEMVIKMMDLSISALRLRDQSILKNIYEMEDMIDIHYKKNLRESILNNSDGAYSDIRCNISTALILKYLERIADHASYIADSISYVETGIPSPRR